MSVDYGLRTACVLHSTVMVSRCHPHHCDKRHCWSSVEWCSLMFDVWCVLWCVLCGVMTSQYLSTTAPSTGANLVSLFRIWWTISNEYLLTRCCQRRCFDSTGDSYGSFYSASIHPLLVSSTSKYGFSCPFKRKTNRMKNNGNQLASCYILWRMKNMNSTSRYNL